MPALLYLPLCWLRILGPSWERWDSVGCLVQEGNGLGSGGGSACLSLGAAGEPVELPASGGRGSRTGSWGGTGAM